MALSNTLIHAWLNALFNNTSFAVGTPYISLHTADPGTTGANEVVGGTYGRQAGSFGVAAAGAIANDVAITFTLMPACTVTHVGIWSASTLGTFYQGGTLTVSRALSAGATAQFAIAALVDSIS